MDGTESKPDQGYAMDYSHELCQHMHKVIDDELKEIKGKMSAISKTLNGGNGDGEGLISRERQNTKFREKVEDVIFTMNKKMVWWLIAIILSNGLTQVAFKLIEAQSK